MSTTERSAMPWRALAGALVVLVGLQLATPNLVGNDSYFHVKYAEVMRHAGVRGFPPDFPWLPLTILAPDRYADHHLLYHVLLTPFTLGDLRIGGKIAAVAGAFAMVVAFAWALRRAGARALGLAVLALGASSADLLFRLSMTRVQALSLVCLFLGFHCATTHRHAALAALACVYAWLYDGFPLLMVPVAAVVVAELATERRLRPGIVAAAAVGFAVGLVVNPYFPEYLTFMWHHMGDKLVAKDALRVGKEWAPYDPAGLFANAGAAITFTAFGVAALGEGRWRGEPRAVAAGLVAVAFFALTMRSQRFVEYFAPTATFFAALAGSGVVAAWTPPRRRLLTALLVAVMAANVVGIGSMLARRARKTPYDRFAPAAEHVARAAPPGAMLCTTDWDDFPWLYFYNVESTYLIGLDPTYLHGRFRDAYWAWVDASLGRVARPSEVFADQLPCAYVLSDRDHGAFLDLAATDPKLEEILADSAMVLYRVRRDGPPPTYPTTPN
ncbi:MAG: hypothetical protein IT293_15520 [Deltaproteobacteria bacterium]|nr:hypothetical protein [Deltaproteobacteria bacterium]